MPFYGDPLAFYGKRIIEEHHAPIVKYLRSTVGLEGLLDDTDEPLPVESPFKIGILGAGIGGLYTALILHSLGIGYEILEASDRAGGHLLTHKFEGAGPYDYYDAGAMRFPLPEKDSEGKYKNGIMKRLADLTEYPPLNKEPDPLKKKLVPYYYVARQKSGDKPGFYYINGILADVPSKPEESFGAEAMKVDSDYIKTGASAINGDVIKPFVKILMKDIKEKKMTGWNVMMANDSHSVRSYMASKYLPSEKLNLPPQHLPNNVINWCSLLGGSSGGYDRALTESVFSSLAFAKIDDNNDYGKVEWKCFDGGSQTLSNKIANYLKNSGVLIQTKRRVTVIEDSTTGPPDIAPHVKVTVNGINGTETLQYSHVISTLPLPVLRTVDLSNAGLNAMQKNALRALDYGPSIKIAILFKSNWWTTKLKIIGGQSFTDLPIRTIVYPSYGVDTETPSKVLIASYCWTTDAYRLGALASAQQHEVLKDLTLRNLAEAHGRRDSSITYEYLKGEFVDMHVKDWTYDEYSMGAFPYFSPGDFGDFYTSLTFPAASKRLHFAGEALSTRHAWVTGALDASWRAVFEYLKVTKQKDKIDQFKKIWGKNAEWTSKSEVVHLAPKKGKAGIITGDNEEGEEGGEEGKTEPEFDLLDEHLGLVAKGILGGVL